MLGPLLFLIYINDVTKNLQRNVKLFADDTSLFTLVDNEIVSAKQLNRDLEKILLSSWQWKILENLMLRKLKICSF